jgi:hypothetical protein
LIVVRQNDGVALSLELEQLFGEVDASPSRTDAEIYASAYH